MSKSDPPPPILPEKPPPPPPPPPGAAPKPATDDEQVDDDPTESAPARTSERPPNAPSQHPRDRRKMLKSDPWGKPIISRGGSRGGAFVYSGSRQDRILLVDAGAVVQPTRC